MIKRLLRAATGVAMAVVLIVVSGFGFGFDNTAYYASALTDSSSQSGSQKVIRVGIPDNDTTTKSGYGYASTTYMKDYLQAVAEYANWNYVYVYGTWSELADDVKAGKVDLLMDVSETPERLKYFNYSSESMGTELSYLVAPKDTSMSYNDFEAFNGITVGYESDSTIIESLKAYGKEKGFMVTAKAYKDGPEMYKAMEQGEVDAVAQTNLYDMPSAYVILAKFSPKPVYIVTSKQRPELKSELDDAMAQLFSYNPSFNADIYELHLGRISSNTVEFTKEEKAYLKTKPVVNVFYETNWAPFEYDDNGTAEGITPDIIRALGEETGIHFKFVLTSSTQSVYDSINGSQDAIMAVSYDYLWAKSHDLLVTEPYIYGSVMRVTATEKKEPENVAVIKGGYLANRVKSEYPELKQIDYDTAAECMDAVLNGHADCTFINYYQANYYKYLGKYDECSFQPVADITQNIAIGITTSSNPLLLGILSKALQHISADKLQSILSDNSPSANQVTFNLLMRRHPIEMAIGLGAVGILIGLVIFLLISLRTRKRQNMALEEAKFEAEKANRAKSEFLSRMSHDIRTPLNGIVGMTYLANESEPSDKTRDYLTKIDTSSKYLLSLINDILDMSKAESNDIELHPEPYEADEFKRYIKDVIEPLAKERKQELSFKMEPLEDRIPVVDKMRLNQIIFNILSNAAKYTDEGGHISYVSKGMMNDDETMHMHIEVSDDGVGMSDEFQKHIFEPFTQEWEGNLEPGHGTGLGMSITKRLVELMGGEISLQSTKGEGTTFFLDFDFATIPSQGTTEDGTCRLADSNVDYSILADRKVLLCEDNPINCEITVALLTAKSMDVDTANNGSIGIKMFADSAEDTYDAVLMDIRMPVMNGYEATREIRAMNRKDAASVPIIAMTADAFDEDVQKCTEAGMNGHVAKPVDPQKLYEMLASLIR